MVGIQLLLYENCYFTVFGVMPCTTNFSMHIFIMWCTYLCVYVWHRLDSGRQTRVHQLEKKYQWQKNINSGLMSVLNALADLVSFSFLSGVTQNFTRKLPNIFISVARFLTFMIDALHTFYLFMADIVTVDALHQESDSAEIILEMNGTSSGMNFCIFPSLACKRLFCLSLPFLFDNITNNLLMVLVNVSCAY